MTDTTNAVPNPGSDEAISKGCKCAVIDNHYGKGFLNGKGERLFWMTQGCPVHDPIPINKAIAP